jgi:hypothetical protein
MTSFPDEPFLALVPVQALASEPGEGGTVVLIRPKILSPRWAWLVRLMKRPNFRVKLDARGTAVWQACDGTRTVAQVMEAMAQTRPDEPDAGFRAALFLRELARGGFVRFA